MHNPWDRDGVRIRRLRWTAKLIRDKMLEHALKFYPISWTLVVEKKIWTMRWPCPLLVPCWLRQWRQKSTRILYRGSRRIQGVVHPVYHHSSQRGSRLMLMVVPFLLWPSSLLVLFPQNFRLDFSERKLAVRWFGNYVQFGSLISWLLTWYK